MIYLLLQKANVICRLGDVKRKEKKMAREKLDYRANIAHIKEMFPGVGALTVPQVAEWLQVDKRTVKGLIERKREPLPAVDIGSGKIRVYRVSVEARARFAS